MSAEHACNSIKYMHNKCFFPSAALIRKLCPNLLQTSLFSSPATSCTRVKTANTSAKCAITLSTWKPSARCFPLL